MPEFDVKIARMGSDPKTVKAQSGQTLGQIMAASGIRLNDREAVRVNNAEVSNDTVITETDRIMIVPNIRGGVKRVFLIAKR